MISRSMVLALAVCLTPLGAMSAQVQIRLGDPKRAAYSELHEGLRDSTPAADTVLRITSAKMPLPLWRIVRGALAGRRTWNEGLMALTRLAELGLFADSAAVLHKQIDAGIASPPGFDPEDFVEPLKAIALARHRAKVGDVVVRNEILARVPSGTYAMSDAWTLGRLGAGTADSIAARFLAATDPQLKVRYLTLLSFSTDTASIPLLARVYAAPDSFGVPPRYGTRASDALLWIGTPASLRALLSARDEARTRGVYANPALGRGGYDFLANDSSAVISRTGRWLTEWVERLGPAQR